MSTNVDWPALVLEALEAIKANAPLPPAPPITEAQTEALLLAVKADLPGFAARVNANPGLITAAGILLSGWTAEGDTWAPTVKAALDALPGGLAMAPTVIGLLAAFSPAPENPDVTGGRGR